MDSFKNIVRATGRNFNIEKTANNYYRLLVDGNAYFDNPSCEHTNGIYEDAESFFELLLLKNEIPMEKKEIINGILRLKNNDLEIIGSRIKDIRNNRGLSLRELSEKTGITHQSINLIENGKCNTGINNLCKIARALDCEIVIKKREDSTN